MFVSKFFFPIGALITFSFLSSKVAIYRLTFAILIRSDAFGFSCTYNLSLNQIQNLEMFDIVHAVKNESQ